MMLRIKHIFHFALLLLFLCPNIIQAQNDEKIQELLDNAEHLTLNNRIDDAIAIYEQIVTLDAKLPLPYYKIGGLLITKGRFVDAIQILEKGVKLENPSKSADISLDKVSKEYLSALELLGNLYSQLYKAREAVFYYESAYNLDENVENKLRYQLEILNIVFAVKKYALAAKPIKLAKELAPNNFDVRFFDAQYNNVIGNYDKSLPILEVLIKEVPLEEGNQKYYYELGVANFQLGKYKAAKESFKNVKGGKWDYLMKKYQPEFQYAIAKALFEVFEFELAEKYLNIALQLDPASAEAHELNQKIATLKQTKGKLIDAKKAAAESAEKEGKTTLLIESTKDLAALYFQNGDYEFALDAIEKWESLDKNINYYRILLKSMTEYKMDKADDSFIMLNKSVKNPRMPGADKARFNVARGLIFMSQSKYKDAEAAFKAAFKGPYKPISWQMLDEIEIIKAQQIVGAGKAKSEGGE